MREGLRRVAKITGWTGAVLGVGALSGLLGGLAVVYAMVYFGDDSSLKKATILARINEETNIYMLDEQTPMGSIFADAHRRYVPIDEVPDHMINALVAAEDKNFYHHHGIDPVAMVAALSGALRGGRVRGASTLTQQTARNILGWWDVTLSRKMKEIIAALQLERLYQKRQILEFYLNQFHVSGNGRGIGIAARYYFNKDVHDLDLIESAFIAGSVKGPSQYDPFIKFTKERRERAMKRAYIRKNYVIRRMYEQGWITEAQFKEAWEKPVKFNRGSFRTDEVSLVYLMQQQLGRKEILDALGIEDARELSAAGLKVFSTIDGELQTAGQLAVRRNLSRLETILKGYKEERPEQFHKLRNLTVNEFFYGQVSEIVGTAKEPALKISFGLPTCTIPNDSLMRYAKQVDLPWYRGWQKTLPEILKKIKVGDTLFVEVKEYDVEKHDGICEMMKRPKVNGGLVALDKGEVRALIPGFDSHGFNRSTQAKRQPGSVFKPVVFFAALQLGWSILDRLDNERQIFPYQGKFYYPRPDHDSPYKEVSMLWAGVESENCAAVSLTSKLVDKLNLEQFKQLMGVMDLLPHAGEPPRDFHFRVARAMGVQLDNEGVREFQLNNAVSDLMLDVQYSSTYDFQQKLKKMWWGRGYGPEMQTIMLGNDGLTPTQKAAKLQLTTNNFLRLQSLSQGVAADWKAIEAAVQAKGAEAALSDSQTSRLIARFRVLPGLSKPALGYDYVLDGERPTHEFKDKAEIEKMISPVGRPLGALDVQAVWGGGALFGSADITLNDVLLGGWMPHAHMQELATYVDKHYNELNGRQEEYDLARYYQHHDFRIAVGLNYLVSLAKAMGVTSDIQPVESFPLGTNDVSLAEVAKIYQTFVAGKTYRFYKEGPPNQLNFIRRIEDRYGNTLYEPKRAEYQLVQPEFGLQMREILQRVVTHGTGRSARAELYLTLNPAPPGQENDPKALAGEKRIRIPAFGKTGTTNDYNSANFAGFIPYPVEKGAPLDPENSYVLAAYTGYDVHQQMRVGGLNITGALGALPAWIGLAKAIITKKKYLEQLDQLDLSLIAKQEWPLKADPRATALAVDLPRGVVIGGSNGADQEAVATTNTAKEGETASDEFRPTAVQAVIRMPLESGGAPLRLFNPYKIEDQLKQIAMPKPTKIEVAPGPKVSQTEGQPGGVKAGSTSVKPGTPGAPGALGAPGAPGAPQGAAAVPAGQVDNSAPNDTRTYDANGNRDASGPLPAPSAPVAAPRASGSRAPGPRGAVTDPADVFTDVGGDGKDEGKAGAGSDDGEGTMVEEELW